MQGDLRRRLWEQAHDNRATYLRLLDQHGELRLRTLRLDDEPFYDADTDPRWRYSQQHTEPEHPSLPGSDF